MMKAKYSIYRILIFTGSIIFCAFITQDIAVVSEDGLKVWMGIFLFPNALTLIIVWLIFGNPFKVEIQEKEDEYLSLTPKERIEQSLRKDFYEGNWH